MVELIIRQKIEKLFCGENRPTPQSALRDHMQMAFASFGAFFHFHFPLLHAKGNSFLLTEYTVVVRSM